MMAGQVAILQVEMHFDDDEEEEEEGRTRTIHNPN
jgi:hypothetical protein